MANKKQVDVKDLKYGDIVYLDIDSDEKYIVLDQGNPYILIENVETHFCYMYHAFNIFMLC